MNDHLDSRTLDVRLETYLKSEEFEQDLYLKAQEYMDAQIPVPPEEQLRKQVMAEKRAWLETYAVCESEGHTWEENADPENGTSTLDCTRCGEHQLLYW